MSTLIPLDGAVSQTQNQVWVSMNSIDVRNTPFAPAYQSLDVRSQPIVTVYLSLTVTVSMLSRALMSLDVQSETIGRVLQGLTIGIVTLYPARQGLDLRGGESFLILADVYPASFPASQIGVSGYYPTQQLMPQLLVNSVEVSLLDFSYEKPANRLGSIFNATLAQFDTTGLDPQARIDFNLLVYDFDNDEWVGHALIVNGRLSGRDHGIGWSDRGQGRGPTDSVSISALDLVGDRFGLAPRKPITMYDPQKVKPPEVKVDRENALRDDKGQIIESILEPVVGLTMRQGLLRAYGDVNGSYFVSPGYSIGGAGITAALANGHGLGFGNIITNIPDYPISRVDFPVEGTYHEGVLPLLAMYGPFYFDLNNLLFIINPTWPLPAGFTPRLLPISAYRQVSLIVPVKDFTNAVVLTYKADAAEVALEEGIYYVTVTKTLDPIEQGMFGQPGYTRVETVVQTLETHHTSNPTQVYAELEINRVTSTYTTFVAGDGGAGAFLLTHRETQTNTYQNELETGHRKIVEGIIATGPDASLELVTVLDEKCEIVWEATDDPDVAMQVRNTTRVEGLVYTATDTRSVLGIDGLKHDVQIRYPALAAQKYGVIQDDGAMGFGPIKTITETLHHTKGSQMDVMVKIDDHLTGTVETSYTQPRTGSTATSRYKAMMRSILLRDLVSEALVGTRKPAGINAGELPRARAIQLGYDVLRFIKTPRHEAKVTLPGVDLSLDRGSVITVETRDGVTNPFLVKGWAMKGENLGQRKDRRIFMTLDGDEL